MSASIKASCPGCRKLIRIPLDWSDRAMKCKRCGMSVQMKRKGQSPEHVESRHQLPAISPTYEPAPEPLPLPEPVAAPRPYGYPLPAVNAPAASPFPYPQQAGYLPPPPMPQYQPAPEPQYQAAPPVEKSSFSVNDSFTPGNRRYQRHNGSGLQTVIALAVGGAILAGCIFIGIKIGGRKANDDETVAKSNKDTPANNSSKVENQNPSTGKGTAKPPANVSADSFPRRMLFIHVAKYAYFNGLTAGQIRGDDLPAKTAQQLADYLRIPTDDGNNQLFVLSDTHSEAKPPPMLKEVLAKAFEDFFATSREQDRILVYFGGHAREIGGKAYLVPVDGDPEDAATLLPLAEVYAKLAACKAQQKIILWDVCRVNPSQGTTRVGSEPMTEALHKALLEVPPGVQVVTSCSAGQNAQETLETGSEFLTALRNKGREMAANGAFLNTKPEEAIPVKIWGDAALDHLAKNRPFSTPQNVTVKAPDPAKTIAFNKEAPPAPRFTWKATPPTASSGEIAKWVGLLNLPGVRQELSLPDGLIESYPFRADVLSAYSDDTADAEIAKNPLRKATIDALNMIRERWKLGDGGNMRTSFSGAVDDAVKKDISKLQETEVAGFENDLNEMRVRLESLGKKHLAEEKSKRWQMLYTYALASVQMRYAFLSEYNLLLGNIKTDSLEKPMGMGTPVYRLVSQEKMRSKKDTTEIADAARDGFEQLAKEHKGTPVEILAKMNRNVALGLAWKLELQQADPMPEEKKE